MALFGRVEDGRAIPDGVAGTALVIEGNSGFSNLDNWTGGYRLQVHVPGRAPYMITHSGWIVREKHPVLGFALPVTVSQTDPSLLRVEWDQAPTMAERIAAGDPAILDPEGTWRRVAPLQFTPAGATADQIAQVRGMVATYLPADSAMLHDIDAAAMRGDPSRYQVSPWLQPPQLAFPPTTGTIAEDRTPATALAISVSGDPYPYVRGDDLVPPGSHFSSRGGSVRCSKHEYLGWLLLCVIPPSGARYGVYFRTEIRSRQVARVLPVTIGRDDPNDVAVEWNAVPNVADAATAHIDTGVDHIAAMTDDMIKLRESSVASAIGSVQDPAIRAQVAQMWAKLGVDTSALQPPGAPPHPSTPGATPTNLATDLARLQKLRDGGVLTETEYQTERSKLLGNT